MVASDMAKDLPLHSALLSSGCIISAAACRCQLHATTACFALCGTQCLPGPPSTHLTCRAHSVSSFPVPGLRHWQAILDSSASPYAQLLASSSLIRIVTEHTMAAQVRTSDGGGLFMFVLLVAGLQV